MTFPYPLDSVNFSKSFFIPINVDDQKAQHLANVLECQIGTMPFTYLVLSLGTTRPSGLHAPDESY